MKGASNPLAMLWAHIRLGGRHKSGGLTGVGDPDAAALPERGALYLQRTGRAYRPGSPNKPRLRWQSGWGDYGYWVPSPTSMFKTFAEMRSVDQFCNALNRLNFPKE
jgi:hypothetical protein